MALEIEELMLADDGLLPNNDRLPLRIYHGALDVEQSRRAERALELFGRNGWGAGWVNGIYDFHHYHARVHEVLAVTRGYARVMFGGPRGIEVNANAGDVILIPAGVGHCRLDGSDDLEVVGAYPAGRQDYDLKHATMADRAIALMEIPDVPLPPTDPVSGQSMVWGGS